jgi:hypothetical protein
MSDVRADLDSPWKDILRAFFPRAIAFFFPQTAELIDWSKPYEFLDKEIRSFRPFHRMLNLAVGMQICW